MTKNIVIALIALIYFLVFLWDLFVMDLVLSGENLIKTAKGHTRSTCRKVDSQAKCLAQYSLSRRLTRDLDSQLAPIASDSWCSFVLLKIVTFGIPITHTIYTLITHRNGKKPIKWKTLGKLSTTHPSSVQPAQEVNLWLRFATCTNCEWPAMFPCFTKNCDFWYSHHSYYIYSHYPQKW